jgi:hypothetical protein
MARASLSMVTSSSWKSQTFEPSDEIYLSSRFGSALHMVGDPLDSLSRRALISVFGVSAETSTSPITFHNDVHSMNLCRNTWAQHPVGIIPDFLHSNPGTTPAIAGRADVGSCVVGQFYDKVFTFGTRQYAEFCFGFYSQFLK